ncbi:hypothetical protein [Gordonia sp. DT101]|uniref:hypothetical protein n=1 Tax=Gordonia sp. DT101 TaxID=3416545 RepID=UPI003CF9C179
MSSVQHRAIAAAPTRTLSRIAVPHDTARAGPIGLAGDSMSPLGAFPAPTVRTFSPTVHVGERHGGRLCTIDRKLRTVDEKMRPVGEKVRPVGDVSTIQRAGGGRADTESVG